MIVQVDGAWFRTRQTQTDAAIEYHQHSSAVGLAFLRICTHFRTSRPSKHTPYREQQLGKGKQPPKKPNLQSSFVAICNHTGHTWKSRVVYRRSPLRIVLCSIYPHTAGLPSLIHTDAAVPDIVAQPLASFAENRSVGRDQHIHTLYHHTLCDFVAESVPASCRIQHQP